MLRNLLKRAEPTPARNVREIYDPAFFDGRAMYERPDTEAGVLGNLHLTTEVMRLDMNERLDTLIELQKELLATQKAILETLQKQG